MIGREPFGKSLTFKEKSIYLVSLEPVSVTVSAGKISPILDMS